MDIQKIKQLREESGAGMLEVKQALEKHNNDYEKASAELLSKASAKAAKKADRIAGDGLIFSYIHNTGKVGSLIHLGCETDFVAKTDDFKALCKEIAMQVCTDDYENIESLLKAEYIRNSSKTIADLITEATAKIGEKLELKRFVKYSISE